MKLLIKILANMKEVVSTKIDFSVATPFEPLFWNTQIGIVSQSGKVVIPYGKLRGFLPAVEDIEKFSIELELIDDENNTITTEIPIDTSYRFWYY